MTSIERESAICAAVAAYVAARDAREAAAVAAHAIRRRARTSSRRPLVGSQEWAETRGDDLGYSGDR